MKLHHTHIAAFGIDGHGHLGLFNDRLRVRQTVVMDGLFKVLIGIAGDPQGHRGVEALERRENQLVRTDSMASISLAERRYTASTLTSQPLSVSSFSKVI